MEQVRTKRKLTREEMEKMLEEVRREKQKILSELDVLDLTEEEKRILVEIKMAFKAAEEKNYDKCLTSEEIKEYLFADN